MVDVELFNREPCPCLRTVPPLSAHIDLPFPFHAFHRRGSAAARVRFVVPPA